MGRLYCMISRKIAGFGLALSVLVSSAAIAYADENTKEENNDYPVAARTMEDAGMTGISAAALNHDPALNVALLADFDGVTLTQLTARAIVKEQEKLAAEEASAREQADASVEAAVRAALLEEYDGVMVSEDLNVRKTPGGTVLRTINGGKVAVYVQNYGNGFADLTAVMKGTNGQTYLQYYKNIIVTADDLNVSFTVDSSHLVFE